jgi:hypothetical protein
MARGSLRRTVALGFALVGTPVALGLVAPRPARADGEQDAIARIVDLNKEAVAQYQKKHYEAAKKLLRQALDLCESSGLDHHPVAARTHVHLGIVIIGGFGQREIGSRQFNEALQIDPNITLTPGLATPAAEDVFNEALVAVSPKSPKAAPRAPEPAADAEETTSAPPQAPTENAAPSETPPPPRRAISDADDETPRAERRAPSPPPRSGEDEEAAESSEQTEAPGLASRIQIGALVGGGVGWASGMGDVNADTHVSGSFAAAKLGHLALSGGYWLTNELMLGLEGRFQMVTGTTEVEANMRTYHPATYATAVFAEGTWSPWSFSDGHLRPYLSAAIGAGKIRHVVTISQLKDCGPMRNETCVDTIGAGPFLAGVGGGLMYDLTERLAFVAALNTQIGAPTFTFNIDLNAGLAFRL